MSETPIWDEMVKEHGDPLQSEDRYVPEPVPDPEPEPVTLADELFDAPPPPTKRTRIRSKRSR